MKPINFFFILLAFSLPLPAQTPDTPLRFRSNCSDASGTRCQYAVSTLGGLKLRQTPGFNGKAVATLPFGTVVELLQLERLEKYGVRVEESDGFPYVDEERLPMTPDSVHGLWAKVRSGQQTGWVFSSYLADNLADMTERAYLLYPLHSHCDDAMFASPHYRYYGIYSNPETGQWSRRPIRPVFYSNKLFHPMGSNSFRASGEPHQPRFVLASKDSLPTGPLGPIVQPEEAVIGTHLFDPPEEEAPELNRVRIPGSSWTVQLEQTQGTGPAEPRYAIVLTDAANRRRQVLHTLESGVYDLLLTWVGDLDGDGQPDFMLWGEGDLTSSEWLFLSRNPRPGDLVVPVPAWRECGGC